MKNQLRAAELITIIADEAIQDKVFQELNEAGSKGYTVSPAYGRGLSSKNFSS